MAAMRTGEDGGVGGSWAPLLPQTHQDDNYMSCNSL